MASRNLAVQHLFGGGWGTDFGERYSEGVPEGVLNIPFLIDAENVVYELNGAPRKAPGASKLNSAALAGGAVIKGIHDFWITGTSGSPAQHRVVHVGSVIQKDDADGSFSNLFTGLNQGAVPSYAVLNDLLVMAQTGSDVPKSWDGTTAQALAGTPPNFSIVVEHKNRLWAAGVNATASRLYYSALLNPEDWVGAGSGEIDISPDDGDAITGLASHKDELWVFKGPYKGSIHRISGSAPTGGDPFARKTFVRGIGASGHNTLFRFKDDLGFMWSDGSIHSLNATSAFGDFNDVALSRPIQTYLRDNLVFSRLNHAWSANCSDCGYVLFSVTISSGTLNNQTLMMDYRFDPPRWSSWPAFESGCIAEVVDGTSNDQRVIMAGGNDGFVRKYQQPGRVIDDSTAIAFKVTTPFLNYGSSLQLKTLETLGADLKLLNGGDLDFKWRTGHSSQQTSTLTPGAGGAVLGPAASNVFTLGTSTLASAEIGTVFGEAEEGGEFRQIEYQLVQEDASKDCEVHGFVTELSIGSRATEGL